MSLRKLARSHNAPHVVVVRANIILDALAGESNAENARRNDVTPMTVRKWRMRIELDPRLAALADAHRVGRPARIPVEDRAELVKIACDRPTPETSSARAKARLAEADSNVRATARARKRARAKVIKFARVANAKAALAEKATKAVTEAKAAAKRAEKLGEQEGSDAKAKVVLAKAQAAKARTAARRATQAARKATKVSTGATKKDRAAHTELGNAKVNAESARGGAPAPFSAIWTHQALQEALLHQTGRHMSRSEIGRTLRCAGLRPHRVRMWLHSPDPRFREKV